MKIAVMLRHLGQHGGGVLVYTHNLLRELLAQGERHRFTLLHADETHLGGHADRPNVRERLLRAPHPLLWDQRAVARALRAEPHDVLFNPKFTVPLRLDCPSVFVCHGLDWYAMPWASKPLDRLSHRLLFPRYARRAARIVAVSDTVKRHLGDYVGVPAEKVRTVHHGLDRTLFRPPPEAQGRAVRARHGLPDSYFLYCGQIYPPKNLGRLLEAYARVGPGRGIHLVLAGTHTFLSEGEIARIGALGLEPWVRRLGWVAQEDLPALYAGALALTMPSLYESFLMPIVEAMAVGCPVLTADRHGTEEIAGGAALLVDPESVESIRAGLERLAEDAPLRRGLAGRGLERARRFDWSRCAAEVLALLEETAAAGAAR